MRCFVIFSGIITRKILEGFFVSIDFINSTQIAPKLHQEGKIKLIKRRDSNKNQTALNPCLLYNLLDVKNIESVEENETRLAGEIFKNPI